MAKPKKIIENFEFYKQCIWKTNGYQCQGIGHLSTGTLGTGPWYCREHFAMLMKWPAYRANIVDDSQDAVDKRVNKLVPREAGESEHDWSMRCKDYVMNFVRTQTTKIPNKDWARKILDREASGEPVALHALLAAREVVQPREPGEDDEALDRMIETYAPEL